MHEAPLQRRSFDGRVLCLTSEVQWMLVPQESPTRPVALASAADAKAIAMERSAAAIIRCAKFACVFVNLRTVRRCSTSECSMTRK